jgi:hypothetical protein
MVFGRGWRPRVLAGYELGLRPRLGALKRQVLGR